VTDQIACLAVETATDHGSVAICWEGRVSVVCLPEARSSVRDIYRSINEAADQAGATLADLDCVAFGCGPGSFTGIRVAASVAQALAFGYKLPVCRISTLAVLAAGAWRQHEARRVAACLDARRHEAYLGVYTFAQDGTANPTMPDSIVDPGTYGLDGPAPVFAAGTGWASYPGFLAGQGAMIAGTDLSARPAARDLLELARLQFGRGETVGAEAALPNYIRERVTGA